MTLTFGDAEAAAVAILSADAGVTALAAGVSVDLVGYNPPARWVRVTRTGGVPIRWMGLDNALLSFDCYAEDKATALDLAAAVHAAVFAARATYTGNGLTVFDVAETGEGVAWSRDDKNPAALRYTFTLAMVTRPT
jgi:hypothetical protein